MSETTFKKRGGTTDEGKAYEDLFVAYLVLQLVNNDDYEDFKISSNHDKFGAFDDVVFELEGKNPAKYAMQLKHLQKKDNLTVASLTGAKGKFSVYKYFESFNNNKQYLANFKLILYTNTKFVAENNKYYELDFNADKLQATIAKVESEGLINTSESSQHCYQFHIKDDPTKSEKYAKYQDFLKSFYLYSDQSNVTMLRKAVGETINKLFSCNKEVTEKYVKFITRWSEYDGTKDKLNKRMMQQGIALCLSSPFMHSALSCKVTENGKLLQDAISRFNVTVFNKENMEQVRRLWGDIRNGEINMKDLNQHNKRYQIADDCGKDINILSDIDVTSLLWCMDKCPIIVANESQVQEAIKLCSYKSFVLLGKTETGCNFDAFTKLADLNSHEELWTNVTENFKCHLPGLEVNLEYLIKEGKNFEDVVTTDDLLEMTSGPYKLLRCEEELPTLYVSRSISCPLIDMKYLESVDVTTTVLISNVTSEQGKEKFKNFEVVNINDYLSGGSQDKLTEVHEGTKIYVSENLCSPDLFNALYIKTAETKNHHHLRLCGESLIWVQSKGNIHDLQRYVFKDNSICVKETEAISSSEDNNVHLVVDGPGMGKSWLMKSLNNQFSLETLTVCFSLEDVAEICTFIENNGNTNIEDFILELKYSNYNDFAKSVLRLLMTSGRVIYFWDAIDEISSQEKIERITDLIRAMAENKSLHWLTSRPHLKRFLEKKFNVLSKSINHFTEQEQAFYIRERLRSGSSQYLDEVTTKIKNNMAFTKNEDILGIPLQVFMLTELFLHDPQKYSTLLQEVFPITELFTHFVFEKVKLLFTEKEKSANPFLNDSVEGYVKTFTEKYQRRALLVLIEGDFLEDLNIDEDYEDDDADKVGFLTEIDENTEILNKVFVHISYAEYFVATYFARRVKGKNNKIRKLLSTYLFQAKYSNVRFFFDMLLAENAPAHIAVLYKNIQELKKCNDEVLSKKDAIGRNVLQVACSWGERYPILDAKATESDDLETYCIQHVDNDATKKESAVYIQQLEYLLDKCDVTEVSDAFKMSSLQYAEKCDCLYAIVLITLKAQSCFDDKDYKFQCSALYYAVKLGYDNVIDLFTEVKYIEINWGNLLHVAVENHQSECLKKLLDVEAYKRMINFGDNGVTPLFLTCIYGHLEMTMLLLSSGANFTITKHVTHHPLLLTFFTNRNRWNPLHAAVFYDHEQIVEQLLLKQKDIINATDIEEMTPLHVSALKGNKNIMEMLIKAGVDVNAVNETSSTALHIASQHGYYDVMQLLVDSGTEIDAVNKDKATALHVTSEKGHERIAQFLIKRGANVNAAVKNGRTSIYLASQNGHDEVVDLLIKSGGNVNVVDEDNWTALHTACDKGHNRVVELLMKSRVDSSVTAKDGRTAFYLACQNGHDSVVEFLIRSESSVDINTTDKDGWTPLHIACQNGHHKVVELLIQSGVDINAPGKDNWTPLHLASQNGHDSIVTLLTESGASVNAVEKGGWTALHAASFTGREQVSQVLITSGVDIHATDSQQMTAFHFACQNGHDEVAKVLIQAGVDVNVTEENGWTPLHIAAQNGHDGIVDLLIKSGASINCVNKNNLTALHKASEHGHVKIVQLLLKEGANVNVFDEDDWTPLLVACQNGHDDVVDLLIKSGADLNVANKYSWTPLHLACEGGYVKVVELLIKSGATIDVTITNKLTPLHVACENGHDKIVDLLITSGVDVNAVNRFELTAFQIACQSGHDKIAEMLINSGANINGNTALHAATTNGHAKVVEVLIKYGVDINGAGKNGWTPLHIASQNGNDEIVALLIKSGVNTSTVRQDGVTALYLAAQNGHEEVVKLLIDSGADVNAYDKNRWTPLHISSNNGHDKVVELLIKADVDINFVNANGCSAFHLACQSGHDNIVQRLINLGVDINSVAKNNWTALHIASERGHHKVVEVLLEANVDVSVVNDEKWTALHIATNSDHNDIVELLIKSSIDIDAFDTDDITALHIACSKGHCEIAKLLIQSGANKNAFTKDRRTPLYLACQYGYDKLVDLLIKFDADVNALNRNNYSALHVASRYGHHKIVAALIGSGADVNAFDDDYWTALHVASDSGHSEIVSLLLKSSVDINRVNADGCSALHLAAQRGHANIVQMFIASGIDVNSAARDNWTALQIACATGHYGVVRVLLEAGANINLFNKRKSTALHIASSKGDDKLVDLLIKSGADVNAVDGDSRTALHGACKIGNCKIAELLIRAGADLNAVNNYGTTALHIASFYDHDEVVLVLVSLGSGTRTTLQGTSICRLDMDSVTPGGQTSLAIACIKGHDKVANILINSGADIDFSDSSATTPINHACQHGYENIVKLLLNNGANVNTIDYNGISPLGGAIHNKHDSIVELLINQGADKKMAECILATPLYTACEDGCLEFVQSFIKMGADVEFEQYNGWSPIHIACFKGDKKIVKELIRSGANVEIATKANDLPVELALEHGHLDVVDLINEYLENGRL